MPSGKKRAAITSFFAQVERKYEMSSHYISEVLKADELKKFSTPYVEINLILKLIENLRLQLGCDEITEEVLEVILKGGHIRFHDGGSFYKEIIEEFNQNLKERYSSHSSCEKQFSFSGNVAKEVLFGVCEDTDSGEKMTWIQFEKNNTKTLINFIMHMFDYLCYKLKSQNIGPFGSSIHTESAPLVIKP